MTPEQKAVFDEGIYDAENGFKRDPPYKDGHKMNEFWFRGFDSVYSRYSEGAAIDFTQRRAGRTHERT